MVASVESTTNQDGLDLATHDFTLTKKNSALRKMLSTPSRKRARMWLPDDIQIVGGCVCE